MPPAAPTVPTRAAGQDNAGASEDPARPAHHDGAAVDVEEWLLDGCPDEYIDPISLELLEDPVCAMDGHVYSRSSMEAHMARCASKGIELFSPMTLEPMGAHLVSDFTLRSIVAGYVDGRLKELEALQGKGKDEEGEEKIVSQTSAAASSPSKAKRKGGKRGRV